MRSKRLPNESPRLLDDVHALMENHRYRNFVLTGSSARKLQRGASNLLAGRALLRKLAPLTSKETDFELTPEQCMTYGQLPYCVTLPNDEARAEYLESYVQTYLTEEIRGEGIVRNFAPFARYPDVAALAAGTPANISALARDAGVARDTVRGYLDIFEDTLLGSWLPAYRPRAKVKEVARPKFYFFDTGVLHAAAGGFRQPTPSDWRGVLMEHWIHHELASFLEYSRSKGTLGYWRTASKSEVDFVWWYGEKVVGIEVKAAKTIRSRQLQGIRSLSENRPLAVS